MVETDLNKPAERESRPRVTFRATHLDITIDPENPSPAASLAFTSLRQQAGTAWSNFEEAEQRLLVLDNKIDADMLIYVSANPRATNQRLWDERYRIIRQTYGPAIDDAEKCCSELESSIRPLEEAARKEPETLEGRATLEIDIGVVKKSLATTMEIVQTAKVQLEQARKRLEGS